MQKRLKRTIIFGDIHGCHEEWQALIDKLRIQPEDDLLSVGDLVCKGPSTKKTLDLAMRLPNFRCVMGNHELYLLRRWQRNDLSNLKKDYQRRALDEIRDDLEKYMRYMESWPFYLNLGECIVVHAGIRPHIPLNQQTPEDLVHLRTLTPEGLPWYDSYQDSKLIVHGHWAKQGLTIRSNVIGLDTGCVYGGELTALILPERQIVSVKARRPYAPQFEPKQNLI